MDVPLPHLVVLRSDAVLLVSLEDAAQEPVVRSDARRTRQREDKLPHPMVHHRRLWRQQLVGAAEVERYMTPKKLVEGRSE